MLNWWMGKSAEDANRIDDSRIEPPETPAPVFAARAIKSAIFGTPKPHDNDDINNQPDLANVTARNNRRTSMPSNMSPTKPQGILLTPGTTTRRKTVSFGAAVVDNETKNTTGKSGIPNDCPGKFPSPWTPKTDPTFQVTRRTALTRSMERARESKSRRAQAKTDAANPLSLQKSNTEDVRSVRDFQPLEQENAGYGEGNFDDFDGDMTMDLNEPHSQSGRYWKSEYERYHEEAQAQMKKLVKYKQLAKSFAQKKDGEAIDLGEKLKEEQAKVQRMEDKISELVAEIAERRSTGNEDESPALMKNLARQTALAVQYKDQVEQFRTALEERGLDKKNGEPARKTTLSRSEQSDAVMSLVARAQPEDMSLLRSEIHSLRLELSAAEKKASRLGLENAQLVRDLAKANEDLTRSEKRRQSADAVSQKRDELIQDLHRDYDHIKELAKSQRREAENLLKKRHDQVSSLKKEIVALKEKPASDTQKDGLQDGSNKENIQAARSELEVDGLLRREVPQRTKLRTSASQGKINYTSDALKKNRSQERLKSYSSGYNSLPGNDDHLLESKIPILERSTVKPVKIHNDEPLIQRTFKNIEKIKENIQESPLPSAGQVTPSLQERFSNLSRNTPQLALPSPEPSISRTQSRNVHPNQVLATARPTSPTKTQSTRPRSAGNDAHRTRNPSPSRLSSMASNRTRITLPPERAAAAKARLEQRSAEKKRGQYGLQKENLRT